MKIILFVLLVFLLYGCSSTPTIVEESETNYNKISVITTNIINMNSIVFISVSNVYVAPSEELFVYVYTNSKINSWPTPQLYYWIHGTSQNGYATKLSNYNEFIVFKITNIDLARHKIGIKLRKDSSWSDQEPIKSENGPFYDRIVSIPIYSITNSYTNSYTNYFSGTNYITNYVVTIISSPDKIFVHSPVNWWESFPYFFESETNLYKDPPTNSVFEWFGANYKGDGITYFLFYGPNLRRVWVVGDFSSWNKVSMYLSKDRVWWWAIVSNTSPGQKYKFVIEKYNDLSLHWISDPAAKKNVYSPGMDTIGNESIIVDHSSYSWQSVSWQRPGYEYPIIYQIHIRTFYTNGPGDYYGWGTFETAIKKFDYLTNLGITAIEPLPINEFAGDQSWGYNYVLFYAPETAYVGTNLKTVDTLKKFVDEAHKRGMAVILDLVFNHIGPGDDIIAAYDPASDWNNPQTYWYSGSTPWGPRFNYSNPMVSKFLVDSARYFMEYFKVDGFRFDATAYINDWGFLQYVSSRLKSIDANVILIAEHLPNDAWVTRKVSAGGAGFDSQWNVNLSHELKKLFISGPGAVDINSISSYIVASYLDNGLNNQSPVGLFAVQYHVSHDEAANGKQRPSADLAVRSWGNSEYDAQGQMITAIATAVMARGTPMLFYGEEFLEGYWSDNQKWFTDTKPLTWANLSKVRATNTMRAVRDLNFIRKNNAPVRGNLITVNHVNNTAKVISFTRGYGTGSGDIYVIINYDKKNYSSYGIPFPSTGNWNLIFAHPSGAYGDSWADAYLTGSVSYSGGNAYIKIPEYGVLIYKKQ
ncbi:MAG: alpha-amylase family glycosyl hydrolase [Brevinematia bacterium]